MQRYNTGLFYMVLGISVVLLMLWGVDLSRSVADKPSDASYQTDVSVRIDGPLLDVLQKTLVVNPLDPDDCAIVFRSERGLAIWKHEIHSVSTTSHEIYLSSQPSARPAEGCVILVTFLGAAEGPGPRMISVQEVLIGGLSAREVPPTQFYLPVSYAVYGWF